MAPGVGWYLPSGRMGARIVLAASLAHGADAFAQPPATDAVTQPPPVWWELPEGDPGSASRAVHDARAPDTSAATLAAPLATDLPDTASPDPFEHLSGRLAFDGFYLVDWNRPADPGAAAALPHRAFDFTHGFALAFAVADIAYEDEHFAAVLNLRFGGGAARLIGNDNPVFAPLKQAFLSWKPLVNLRLDFGQFDTIYGGEVAESWENPNYTRGALYFLLQPFYHQGLRLSYDANEAVALTMMLVNGTNNVTDNNQSPHLGLQLGLSPNDDYSVALGYYTGAGSSGFGRGAPGSDDDWEHFVDVVFTGTWGPVSTVANANLYVSGPGQTGSEVAWGVSLAGAFSFSDPFGIALRAEFLHDPDRFFSGSYPWLSTTTLTFDYQPVDALIFRLDTRFEFAGADVFAFEGDANVRTWLSSTLGVVAKVDR